MKKYLVTFSYGIEVEAENKGIALEKAFNKWNEVAPIAEEMNIETEEVKNEKV